MSNTPDFVQGIQMPNMKKKAGSPIDLMRPGDGTPWEDRGSIGAVGAYFKTMVKSLFSPARLMDHIRRPETTTDSRIFAMISTAMWMIGVIIYNLYWLYVDLPKSTEYESYIDPMYFWLTVLIQLALIGGVAFVWLTVGPRLFRTLGATELKGAPPSLISNCFNYAMGPSILAVIPFFGWILAFVWILFDMMAAARRRLYMKYAGAIINVVMLGFLAVVISAVAWTLLHFVWGSLLGMNGLTAKTEVKPITPHVRTE